MSKCVLLFVTLALFVCTSAASAQGVPSLINYQGKLFQPSGASVPDAKYKVIFSIYDVPTGGTALWTETYDALQVTGSAFHVLLGSVNPIGASIFSGADRYLGVQLGADAELSPRQKIASVPYAMHSVSADTVPDGSVGPAQLASDAASLGKVSGGTMAAASGGIVLGTGVTVSGDIMLGPGANNFVLAVAPWERFSYDGSKMARYGIGWMSDTAIPGAPIAFLSGWGGIKLFTTDSARVYVTSSGDVQMSGSLAVAGNLVVSGTKSAVVQTQDFGKRLLYAVEAPTNRFTDEGKAQLSNGQALVKLDPVFLETIEGDLLVQVTPYGNASLYVAEVGADHFTVKSRDGDPNVAFAWQVSAFRKGYSKVRLGVEK